MVILWSILFVFYQMSSAILLAKILVLFMNVRRVEDSQKQGLQCNWVCNVTESKGVVGTREQIGANFKFSKPVNQTCTDDTTVNSWDFIRVGIIVAPDVDNPSEFSFSDFLTFGIEHVLPRQFLFGSENTDLESINGNVSCRLQPTLNETGGVASNGLDALHSPLFYLRNIVKNSQKTLYLGYVEIGGRFYLTAGFTNSMSPEYRLEFDQSFLTPVKIFSVLFLVYVLLCSPSIFALFCSTIKTVQIGRLSHAHKSVEEPEEDLCSETTRSPIEQEDSITESQFTAAGKTTNAGKESLSSRVATEHGEFNYNFSSWTNDDLQLGSSTAAIEHAPLISTRLPNQENNYSNEHSVMVSLRPTAREKNLTTSVPMFSQTQIVVTSDHRASGSSSAMEEIERSKPQTGVQHQNFENRKLDSVQVMDVEALASPVGLRSFIANKVFSNSTCLSLPYKFVKFLTLIMFPIFTPILIDVFVLAIPGQLFPRIASSLPSPFLIKFVFIFTYEVCPWYMYVFLVCYIFRIVCFCFLQSSSNNWVPSFLCRKHLVCFCRNHYLSQFIYPSNSWSACDECKEAPDLPKHCEIPVNIKCNDGCSLLEIVKKDWKDVSQNFYPELCGWVLGNEDESFCTVVRELVCLIIGGLVFILLVILDIVASLPIISLCYGRVWFTKNWSQNRHTQLGCFIGEFCVICFSVVGIAYYLFCSFLSMAVALSCFCIAAVNYPVEIVFYLAINIMVWHIIWSCYTSFTNIYDDILLKLFNACSKYHESELNQYKEGSSKDHESELNQYEEGNVQYIPEKLFTSACDKIKPVGNSFKKLLFRLCVWVVGLFFLLSFIFGSSTDISISKVLAGTVTFLVVVHPSLWDFLLTRGKKEARKDGVLKKKVKGLVDAFFKSKLD